MAEPPRLRWMPRSAGELHDAILAVADKEIAKLEKLPFLDEEDLDKLTKLERFVVNRLADQRKSEELQLKDKTQLNREDCIEIVRTLIANDPEIRAIAAEALASYPAAS